MLYVLKSKMHQKRNIVRNFIIIIIIKNLSNAFSWNFLWFYTELYKIIFQYSKSQEGWNGPTSACVTIGWSDGPI